MNVSVAVRQKFHGFQLAQQLEKNNCLNYLFTSLYGKVLGKDNSVGYTIDPKKIKTNIISAIYTYGLNNNGYYSDDLFGKWVANKIEYEDLIVTWGIQALPIIEKASKKNIKVALERGSAHVIEQRDILLAEYAALGIDSKHLENSFSAKRMERELLEYDQADIISIPSSFVKKSFLKHGIAAEKLFMNPYGVNLQDFTCQPIAHSPFRIIYTGSISIRKGIHYLLKAFCRLNLKNSELWLVGKADKEIKPILAKYSHPNIFVFDAVPQKELSEFYNKCDVFSICSIEEGLAMVQAQAMACGLPVICTTNTGGDDLIEEGKEGFILPIRDVKAIEEKIEYLYCYRTECRAMGKNAAEKVESNFTWDDYGKRAVKAYGQIINK